MGVYRYGFNGKENDNEIKGEGNQQDYGMRVYDPRIGKFLSVDPITHQYPELTPYQFASNSPIQGVDFDGLELINNNKNPQFLKITGGRATLEVFTATAVTKTAIELSKRMAVNAAGELVVTSGATLTASWIGTVILTAVLTSLPLETSNYENSKVWVDQKKAAMERAKAFYSQAHIEEFKDPSGLSDEYLAEVENRINQGIASGQDYLYAKEIAKRKRESSSLSGSENDKKATAETITFIQGSGANAKEKTLTLPTGFKKTKLKAHGQAVYSDGKRWITPDQDGHNGGAWKVYSSESDVGGGKSKRDGTYDKDLKKIGD